MTAREKDGDERDLPRPGNTLKTCHDAPAESPVIVPVRSTRLIRLLKQTGSAATLDDIKTIIFEEDAEQPFIVYVMRLTDLFGDEDDRHIDALIPAIQDAWNYFPHRRMKGSCPAELMLRQVPGLRPRDLRA